MSTLLDDPNTQTTDQPAERLRMTMAAIRVSLSWLGVRKTLTPEQRSQAADTFGAEGNFLSAGKKLLDNRHGAGPHAKIVHLVQSLLVRPAVVLHPENG